MEHERKQYGEIDSLIGKLARGQDPYPYNVEIHPTDICNHRCDYCFHGGVGFDARRVPELVSLERYATFFKEMNDLGISQLSISGGGDPSLDGRLGALLREAHAQSLETRLVTHGNIVAPDVMDQLVRAKEVRFSVDAITPETYARIRHVPGDLLFKTLQHIDELVARKRQANAQVSIGTTFLLSQVNVAETEDFFKSMLARGVDTVVLKYDIYGEYAVPKDVFESVRATLGRLNDPRVEARPFQELRVPGTKCFVPYFKIAANPYGELFSCCLGSQPGETSGYLLGNLRNNTFAEIWTQSAGLRAKLRQTGVACANCNHTDYALNKQIELRLSE